MLLFIVYAILAYFVITELRCRLRPKNLRGETVLITGGGSGMGRLLAVHFAKAGSNVAICDVSQKNLDETSAELRALGANNVYAQVCDVTNRTAVNEMTENIRERLGDVTILINNAGIVSGKPLMELSDSQIERTMNVNTISHFWTTRTVLPAMLQRNHGHVVTIASAAGLVGVSNLTDYCASKFGAVGFNEALRSELRKLGKTGIDTLVVCPYYVDTGMFEGTRTRFPLLLPILKPDYVANRIMASIRQRRTHLTLPWLVSISPLLKSIVPTAWSDWILEFLGVSVSMDHFTGRVAQGHPAYKQ